MGSMPESSGGLVERSSLRYTNCMIGFFVKKAFFDGWDHLYALVGMNLAHLVLALLFFALPLAAGLPAQALAALAVAGVFAMSLWQTACARLAYSIADYGSPRIADALRSLREDWGAGLQLGAMNLGIMAALLVGIPFYLSMDGFLPMFAAALLFWTAALAMLVLQYYLPIRTALGGGFAKNLRKALVLALDNPGFSLFLAVHGLVTMVLSALPAFLAPGLAGLAVAQADAVKLRLFKYDWIEKNPQADRRAVPWDSLLAEERELVGERTLRGMIFPWKEGK